MNFDKLLEYLGITEPGEFEYFENMADLVEAEAEIPSEAVFPLFEGADKTVLEELFTNYFEEMLKAVPEDAVELYTLLDSVKLSFIGMLRNLEEERDLVLLADEFCRFRSWYSLDSEVWVQAFSSGSEEICMPLRDALTLSRMERLGGEKYEYIFDDIMGFEMDEYTMSFAELAGDTGSGQDRDIDLETLSDVDFPGLEYTDQIFTPDKSGKLH